MLQLFTKRQSNLGIILILLSLVVLQFFSHQQIDFSLWTNSAPLAQSLYTFLGEAIFSNSLFTLSTSFIVVVLQLILVYQIVSKIKTLEKNSILVTWIYCWLIHLFPQWSSLTPISIASVILLFLLYRIYTSIDAQSNNFLFNISSLLGISFLLWYPSILLLPYLAILLFQYNAISVRRISILILSFSIPIIWYCLYYILMSNYDILLYQFASFHLASIQFYSLENPQWMAVGLIAFFIILGFIEAWSLSNKTAKMSRLFINSLFLLLIFLTLGAFLSINTLLYSFVMMVFPASLFVVLFINNFKRKRFAEIAHIILLLAIMLNFAYQIIQF